MTELETTLAPPLIRWEDGTIRIQGSRVKLDNIINEFKAGATAEQIQDSFPSAALREIYGAIFYYLENQEAIEQYLRLQSEAEEEGVRFIDDHFDNTALRERILARRGLLMKK